jgi:hypothetical protein
MDGDDPEWPLNALRPMKEAAVRQMEEHHLWPIVTILVVLWILYFLWKRYVR